jgi:hypothetical protein
VNDHLHPLFAGILNAAASRPDITPPGAVPVPARLPTCEGCGGAVPPGKVWCTRECYWRTEGAPLERRDNAMYGDG